jgi:hypothetical protein
LQEGPGCGQECGGRVAGDAAGRVGPVRPPRNSLSGLVRRNRCVQVARVRQCGRQRFRQRCQARSDSRGNLPGPTRPATALRCYEFPKEHCDPSGTSMLRSFGITMRHPREGGDPSGVAVRGRGFSLVWSVTGRVGPVRPPRNSLAGLVWRNRCRSHE